MKSDTKTIKDARLKKSLKHQNSKDSLYTLGDDNHNDNFSVSNDNQDDNFPALEMQIIQALKTTDSLSEVARAIKRNKSNTHRTLKKLIKKGFVEKLNQSYILSGKAHVYLKKQGLSSSLMGSENDNTLEKSIHQTVRAHRIQFNVLLWHVPDGWKKWINTCCGLNLDRGSSYFPRDLAQLVRKYSLVNMRNNNPCEIGLKNGFSFRVHNKGVLVRIPEVIASTSSEAAEIAFNRLMGILPKIERWLRLNPTALYKDGRLNIRLVTSEYALIKNAFARTWVHHRGGKDKFLVEGPEGELRLLVDMSPPYRFEFESVHPVHGERDCATAQEWFKDVIEEKALRPSVVRDRIDSLESGVGRVGSLLSDDLTPVLSEFAVQMKAHVGTAKGLNSGSLALNNGAEALTRAVNVFGDGMEAMLKVLKEEKDKPKVLDLSGGGWR